MKEDNNCKHTHGFFRILGGIIAGTFVAALFALIIGALIMVLWNWLMPVIFGLGIITYWQGFGIALLARLLFGGMGHKGHSEKMDPHMHASKHKYAGHMHHGPMRNWQFDDVYEDWWEAEGSQRFNAYMKDKKKESDKSEPQS